MALMVWYDDIVVRQYHRHSMMWSHTVLGLKVWYTTVWYSMVWYGMVWCGMVWYGVVWYVTVGTV